MTGGDVAGASSSTATRPAVPATPVPSPETSGATQASSSRPPRGGIDGLSTRRPPAGQVPPDVLMMHNPTADLGLAEQGGMQAVVHGPAPQTRTQLARRVATQALTRAGDGARAVGHGLTIAGAHVSRQAVCMGLSYLAREMVGHGVSELLQDHSKVAVGVQAALVLLSMGAQAVRVASDQRDTAEAARGAAGLSVEEWEALSDEERQPHLAMQSRASAIQVALQAVGSSLNLAMAVHGHLHGEAALAAAAVATEVKSMVGSLLRDTLQASFSMVGTSAPTTGALRPAHIAVAAVASGVLQGAVGLGSDRLRSNGDFTPHAVFDAAKNGWKAVLAASAVKAGANALIEAADDNLTAALDVHEARTSQTLAPSLHRPTDAARLLDQSPARHAFLNTFLATLNAVDHRLDQAGASNRTRSFVGNGAAAALGVLLYPTTVALFQGSAAVRAAVTAAGANAPLSALAAGRRAVANSGPVRAAAHAAGQALALLPQQQIAALARRITRPHHAADAAGLRSTLQANLEALATAAPEASAAAQAAAHEALQAYGAHAGTLADGLWPLVHKTLQIGVAGTAPTFGVARSTGLATATQITGAGGRPGDHTLKDAASQWALGALMGAVGHVAAQHLIAPLVNLIGRQHAPVDASAVVPDAVVQAMNTLEAGAGDRLRAEVGERQAAIEKLNSATNVGIGQIAFDTATAVRTLEQGTEQLDFADSVGVGLVVSASAGAVTGASMALNAALSTIKVPDLQALTQAAAQGVPLADVPTRELPLFFTRHAETGGPIAAVRTALGTSLLRDPTPGADPHAARAPQNWAQRAAMVTADISNVATSVGQRAVRLAWATSGMGLASAVTPFVAAGVSSPALASAARTLGATLGIHSAINSWFNQVVVGIPNADERHHANRAKSVNASAADEAARLAARNAAV